MSLYLCAFPGCLYPTSAYGWCAGHYRQAQTTGQLLPLTEDPEVIGAKVKLETVAEIHRWRETEARTERAVEPTEAPEPEPEPVPVPVPEPVPVKEPRPVVKRYTSMHEKLQDLLEIGPECWDWKGPRHSNGSPLVSFGYEKVTVHRHLFEWLTGPLPETARLVNDKGCHCANPGHYRLSAVHERNSSTTPARGKTRDRGDESDAEPEPAPEPAPAPAPTTVTPAASAPIVTAPVLLRAAPAKKRGGPGRQPAYASATEKFWALTEVTEGCWHWKGPRTGKDPILSHRDSQFNAQRFSWELHRGPLDPTTPNVIITNPPWCGCVNPGHLRARTRGEVQKMHNAHRRARTAAKIPYHTWRYEPRPVILPGLETVMGR